MIFRHYNVLAKEIYDTINRDMPFMLFDYVMWRAEVERMRL